MGFQIEARRTWDIRNTRCRGCIAYISQKARRAFFALNRKIKPRHIPVNIALKLFHAYVTPILLFGAEVWNVHERHNFESWEK